MKSYQIELATLNGTLHEHYSHLVDEKISQRYSISEQIALLRQRDEKPEEFAAFYEYAEACKAEVKAYLENPPSDFDESKILTFEEYEATIAERNAEKTKIDSE